MNHSLLNDSMTLRSLIGCLDRNISLVKSRAIRSDIEVEMLSAPVKFSRKQTGKIPEGQKDGKFYDIRKLQR